MLKKITLTHVLLVAASVSTIIFGIYYYNNSYIGSTLSGEEIIFQSDTLFVITNPKPDDGVYALAIEIQGTTTHGLDIDLVESGKLMQSIHFNTPYVEYKFQNDWYSDTCTILLRPSKVGQQDLLISHHFFTN